jgi:non-ribosomal peptide synthetase component F
MDVTGLIGLFANTLALRTVVDTRKNNLQYLHELQTGFLSDLDYGAYPFIKLVDELTGVDASALANASLLFNYQQYDHVKDTGLPEDDGGTPVKIVSEQNDIVLSVSEFKNCLQVRFVMNRQTFDAAQALEIKALYFQVLRSMIDHPHQLPLLSNGI